MGDAPRPVDVAAGALLLGGLLVVAVPQHAGTIVRIVAVTFAAIAALYVVTVHVPEWRATWWRSPFNRTDQRRRPQPRSEELKRIRASMAGRRVPLENGSPLPPETLRLLQPLIRVALEREGHSATSEHALNRLSPVTRSVLDIDPRRHQPWYRTRRPDEREVAEAVHAVLDDLDRLRTDHPNADDASGTDTSVRNPSNSEPGPR